VGQGGGRKGSCGMSLQAAVAMRWARDHEFCQQSIAFAVLISICACSLLCRDGSLRRSEDPALAMEALTDDVAVMVLLCPWQDGVFPAPLCVCSALLLDGAANPKAEAVRTAQAR